MKRIILLYATIFISNLSFGQISLGGGQELDFGIGIKYKSVSDDFVNTDQSFRGYIFSAYGRFNNFDRSRFFWAEFAGDGGFLKSGLETNFDNRLGHTASFMFSTGYLFNIYDKNKEMNIYFGPSLKTRAQYHHIIQDHDSNTLVNMDSYLFLGKIAASTILNYAPYRSGWELRWQLDVPLFAFYYRVAEQSQFVYAPNILSVNSSLRYLRDFGQNFKLGATSKLDYYNVKSENAISYLSASIFFTVIMEID
jgi:hypothetical protein